MSAQPEERQDEHDHDDQTDEIDETIHLHSPPTSLLIKQGGGETNVPEAQRR
jgi:hypothetical protein